MVAGQSLVGVEGVVYPQRAGRSVARAAPQRQRRTAAQGLLNIVVTVELLSDQRNKEIPWLDISRVRADTGAHEFGLGRVGGSVGRRGLENFS